MCSSDLKGITIHTYDNDFYRSYTMEISKDGFTWQSLVIDGPETKPSGYVSYYTDISGATEYERFIRIKGNDYTYGQYQGLAIYGLEIFGSVQLEVYKCSMRRSTSIPIKTYATLILLYYK